MKLLKKHVYAKVEWEYQIELENDDGIYSVATFSHNRDNLSEEEIVKMLISNPQSAYYKKEGFNV